MHALEGYDPFGPTKDFLGSWLKQEASFSALCRYFGISRPTGYKWLARFEHEGVDGVADRSRAPLAQPRATATPLQNEFLALRATHPTWVPKKLRAFLEQHQPRRPWPAPSLSTTSGAPTSKAGSSPATTPAAIPPLSDAYSRFLLRCCAVPKSDGLHVRRVFESAFREFGLPRAIRTDNGPPLASPGLAGLSRLSVWWIRLGIHPDRIDLGCPQQNGRHESFHPTLQQDTASPPKATLPAQQRASQSFRRDFNSLRPHEALGLRPPADFYRPSPRPWPDRLPELVYPFAVTRRRISAAGHLSWNCHQIYVTQALQDQDVALRSLHHHHDDGLFEVFFGPLLLGWLDSPSATFSPNLPPPRKLLRARRHP